MSIYIPENIKKLNPGLTERQLSRYIDNVWRDCAAMKPGDVMVIKQVAENYPELFTECVKDYMRNHEWQDGLSFTKGFEAVQKWDISRTKSQRSNTPPVSPLDGGIIPALIIILMLLVPAADLFAPGINALVIEKSEGVNPWIPVWEAVKYVELQGKPDTTINRDEWAYGPGQIRWGKLEDYNKANQATPSPLRGISPQVGRKSASPPYTLEDCLREPVAREIFMWHCCQYPNIETAVMRWNGSGPRAEEYLRKVKALL